MSQSIVFLLLFFSLPFKQFAQNFWEETNGPEGGFVQCLAVNKSGVIFAGFQAGNFDIDHHGRGLYKSDNFGANWQLIDINSNKDVQSITIDTSGTIYIWVLGAGVLKSTDNGITWVLSSPGMLSDGILSSFKNNIVVLGQQDGLYFSRDGGQSWVLNSLAGSVYYIFVDDSDNVYVFNTNLYKSTDYGDTWSSASNGLGGTVYAITHSTNSTLYAGTSNKIFVSHDFGQNWSRLDKSPQNVISLASGINGEIYAGTYDEGFFVSTDLGRSWTQMNNGLTSYHITDIINVFSNKVIIGTFGDGVYSYSDSDPNWHSINSGIKSVTITSFMKFKEYLFAGSDKGIIYKTSDRGDTWEKIDSIYTELDIHCFGHTKTGSMFFSSNSGIFKSVDEGKSWFKTANITTNKFATYLDTMSNIEYLFAIYSYGIKRSTDDGNTWYTINNGLLSYYMDDIKVNTLGYVFATNDDEIYRSTDYGLNWEVVYECPITVQDAVLALSSNDYLYAGFDFGKVILSTDYGNTWIDRGQNLPLNRVNSITSDLQNCIYAGSWSGKIYKSTDAGENWIDIGSGTIGGPILNLYCDDIGNIFVGPIGGSVYRGIKNTITPAQVILYSPPPGSENQSLNPELKWFSSQFTDNYRIQIALNENFDSTALVYDLSTPDTTIIIGPLSELTSYYWRVSASNQFGSSIWSDPWMLVTLETTQVEENDDLIFTYMLNQNFPNPFNPITIISYSIPQSLEVTLQVFDLLGREVATLVNEKKPAGAYDIQFDGTGLISGVYFYQLQAGNYIETKKMILLR